MKTIQLFLMGTLFLQSASHAQYSFESMANPSSPQHIGNALNPTNPMHNKKDGETISNNCAVSELLNGFKEIRIDLNIRTDKSLKVSYWHSPRYSIRLEVPGRSKNSYRFYHQDTFAVPANGGDISESINIQISDNSCQLANIEKDDVLELEIYLWTGILKGEKLVGANKVKISDILNQTMRVPFDYSNQNQLLIKIQ